MKVAPHRYKSVLDAARGLLIESVGLVQSCKQEFAVVGGWSPYLLNASPIPHPGTKDVDLLFVEGNDPGALKPVIQYFLRAGYVLSAKHPFQLLRALTVKNQTLVFNVDFLHPRDNKQPDLFCDHIEFPIPINEYKKEQLAMVSIAVPEASVIFDGLVVPFEIDGITPAGKSVRLTIPLMDELGLIITKSKSFTHEKRPRDLFDIYLAITQARNLPNVRKRAKDFRSYNAGAFHCISGLRDALIENPGLDSNIWRYLPKNLQEKHRFGGLIDPIRKFVRSVGINWPRGKSV